MSQSAKRKEIVLNALRNYRNALNNQIDLFTDDKIEALKIPHIDKIVAIYGEASYTKDHEIYKVAHKLQHQVAILNTKQHLLDELGGTLFNEKAQEIVTTNELRADIMDAIEMHSNNNDEVTILKTALNRIDETYAKIEDTNDVFSISPLQRREVLANLLAIDQPTLK